MRLHHRPSVLAAAFALIAAPALAQEAPDPIGALLDQAPTPAPAAQERLPVPPPPTYVPPPPRPSTTFRRPQSDGPVQIDEVGRTPDTPPTASDRNYEARMRASFAASQGMQGPLDGRWVIRAGQAELYELQLVDKSSGVLEGAWRNPRRKGAADAAGFVEDIQRYGSQLTVRIQARPGVDPVRIVLEAAANGEWTGQLTEAGDRRAVTMKRD